MSRADAGDVVEREVAIAIGTRGVITGTLRLPPLPAGLVLFAHGSGSSRHSPRNRFVAATLNEAAIGTLLLDLLTPGEAAVDERTAELRFDIGLLAARLVAATWFVRQELALAAMPLGYFGASTGAAAALVAAAALPGEISAIVSRGGRPDLAGRALGPLRAPTLLIVGGRDRHVLELNEQAAAKLSVEVRLAVVPGATHLFEEPGALEEVSRLACDWFTKAFARRGEAQPREV